MGCSQIKESQVVPQQRKVVVHAPSSPSKDDRQYSLYTVKEELSDMEQSYAPSKRQSILTPLEMGLERRNV